MKIKIVSTPYGFAGLVASEKGIVRIVLPKKSRKAVERELNSSEPGVRSSEQREAKTLDQNLKKAFRLLEQYFSGERVAFDLPLDFRYHTHFQQSVWNVAADIPYGETRSYAWIAKRIGKPQAARAVGQAMGANPLPIVIPCHRVISSAGGLGGFSGGLKMKKSLLKLEAGKSGRCEGRKSGR